MTYLTINTIVLSKYQIHAKLSVGQLSNSIISMNGPIVNIIEQEFTYLAFGGFLIDLTSDDDSFEPCKFNI